MKATVRDIYQAIDKVAPFNLAVPGDNVGILVGDPEQIVEGVLVALDAATPVVEQARELGAQLIVTHHPILRDPVNRLLCGDPNTQAVYRMAQAGLSMIAAHTNLDIAPGGINDELAARLGWEASIYGDILRVGEMTAAYSPQSLMAHVQRCIGGLPQWIGREDARLERFAICGGSGGSELQNAKAAGADVLIMGELKHDQALAACEMGMCVMAIGHGASEICAVDLLRKHLQNASDALEWKLCVHSCTWKLLV